MNPVPTILIVPGLDSSGPDHWQSHFERDLPNCIRVQQSDWVTPECLDWIQIIEQYVARYDRNVVLVSHSCGSLAVAHWAKRRFGPVVAAMIVAPTDVEVPNFPYQITGFLPIPLKPLNFPAVVVASHNDPYASFERSAMFAKSWNAKLIDIGNAGHINTTSGHGRWLDGEQILRALLDSAHQIAVAH